MCWTKKWGKSHHLTRRQLGKLDACTLNSFNQDTEKRKVDRWTSWKLHAEGNLFFHQVSSYALLFQKETPKCWCVLRKNREICFFHYSSQVWLPNEKGFTKILALKTRFTIRLFNSKTQFVFSTFLYKFWLTNEKVFTNLWALETRFAFKLFLLVNLSIESSFALKLFLLVKCSIFGLTKWFQKNSTFSFFLFPFFFSWGF